MIIVNKLTYQGCFEIFVRAFGRRSLRCVRKMTKWRRDALARDACAAPAPGPLGTPPHPPAKRNSLLGFIAFTTSFGTTYLGRYLPFLVLPSTYSSTRR